MISFDRVLMDGITDMVFVISVEDDSAFYYEFLNRAALERTGLTKHVLGKKFAEVYPEAKANNLYNHYKRVVTTKGSLTYEDSYLSANGEKSYSRTVLTPLMNDHNICQHIVAVVKDITKERHATLEKEKTLEYLNESKKRYKSLFHHNTDAIIILDLDGVISNGNAAVPQVTGYKRKELFGIQLQTLVIEKDISTLNDLFGQAKEGLTDVSQITITNKSGDLVVISLKLTPLIIDGELVGIYGILRDVTDYVTAQRNLEESEERFRIIAENAHDLISLIDDQGHIIYASPSYSSILGFDHEEYEGNLFLHNIHPDDTARINEVILQSINSGDPFTVKFRQFNNKDSWVWSESNGTPVFDHKNRFKHLVVLTRDISIQKEYESKLEYFAHHDPLTALPNRRYFRNKLSEALEKQSEDRDGLAVIMMDIDYFKTINDSLGHDIGDWVIEEFGKRVCKSVREGDIVGRLGGDEFVILLPRLGNADTAINVSESIQAAMQRPWEKDGQSLQVTTSMGIAFAPFDGATEFSVLKCADQALYEAKDAGRNGYKVKELNV